MTPACLAQAVVWHQGAGGGHDCVAPDSAREGQLVGEQVALLVVPVPWAGGVHMGHVSQWPVLLAGQLQQLEAEEGGRGWSRSSYL